MRPRTSAPTLATCAALLASLIGAPAALATSASAREETGGEQLFELRVYTTAPGKLPHLHRRFRDHTSDLFVKHGMRLVAYWTPVDREDTLIYVLAYPSAEAREASWKAFRDDPEWQKVYRESHEAAGGKIVSKVESTLMRPTDYSPMR
jgi:hypothetical protein